MVKIVPKTSFTRRSFMAMPLALMACKPDSTLFEITGLTMGTTYTVVAMDPSRRLDETVLRTAISAALDDVNSKMSNWDPASEISAFNAKKSLDAVPMSSQLAEVMAAAEHVHEASEGRFDTTIGPLIELWGFGAPGRPNRPSLDAIDAAMSRSGHKNTLGVGGETLTKVQSDTQVYLAAIGKGYGADAVGHALEELGVQDYLVEIGGDLYASGRNGDGMRWQIGIETPDAHNRGVMDVVPVSNMGLATSGDYRNYFEEDGVRYSHVIDPTTGRPINHKTASATVIAPDSMLADAWATAMLILGRDRGLEVARKNDVAVLFVERDAGASDLRFKVDTSDAFKALTA